MKKELGIHPYAFPMPVLMISTYGEDGKVDVMNMAWGGICAENMVALNIDEDHKTAKNIKARGAFTLSVADIPHIEAADFFGIATGNKMEDKFERSGLHAVKSQKVDAPVVEEFPLTLECKVVECQADSSALAALNEDQELTATFAQLLTTADYNSALMDLEQGAVDAVAMDVVVASYQIQQRDADFVILDETLSSEAYAVGFKKGSTELRDAVQGALEEMAADGTMKEISEKWFGEDLTVIGK